MALAVHVLSQVLEVLCSKLFGKLPLILYLAARWTSVPIVDRNLFTPNADSCQHLEGG